MNGTNSILVAWAWELLCSGAVSALLLAALAFIFKSWLLERLKGSIKFDYDRALENHKAQLQSQGDAELETLKATLKAKVDAEVESLKAVLKAQSEGAVEVLKAKLKGRNDSELEGLKAALKAQGDAEIEATKAINQRWIHIDKSQFDLELSSFKTVWEEVSEIVYITARLANLYSYSELEGHEGERRKNAVEVDDKLKKAHKVITDVRPFIPEELHESCQAIAHLCTDEIRAFWAATRAEAEKMINYSQEDADKIAVKTARKIVRDWDSLAEAIRARLSFLSQAQFGLKGQPDGKPADGETG